MLEMLLIGVLRVVLIGGDPVLVDGKPLVQDDSNPDPNAAFLTGYWAFEQTNRPTDGFTPDSSSGSADVEFFIGTGSEPLHFEVTNSPLNHAFEMDLDKDLTAYTISNLTNDSVGTISTWIRSDVDDTSVECVFYVGTPPFNTQLQIVQDSRNAEDEISIFLGVDGVSQFLMETTGDFVDTYVGDGIWHNLMFTQDGTNVLFHFDGVLVTAWTTNISVDVTAWFDDIGAATTPGTNIYLGHRDSANRFMGAVDDYKVYSKVLNAFAEIPAVFNESNPTNRGWDQPDPQ